MICVVTCDLRNIIHILIYICKEWIDEFMRWDPVDYGGLTAVVVDPSRIWVPKLAIGNR